ncbi:Translation machinery-associated protein 20 [Nosema bombycis CQ1]|uniref:Translation machinery-associated protein 20 n=1 Tax=Nosema bombycis (strain CQ1 / CVCC 102059) TaxID=578461 RepID=R0KQZ3_NOSB1|nr:Translation machinery-associated protein 20 [Nosema bombycis CQ1]|eukprot:EOB13156.1 Translation machinery-associated protein 20 [Nosema bombycis CQ1]
MKSLFTKVEPFSTSILGKKDKKTINNTFKKEVLDKNNDYKLMKCKNKTLIIIFEGKGILFQTSGKYYPTVKCLEDNDLDLPCVYVDDGAIGPIHRGANVMAPGIYKFYDKIIGDFKRGSPVVIKLTNGSVLGIGNSLVDKKNIGESTSGEAIDVLHHSGDDLYKSY